MPVTKYEIANRALLKLGANTLSSFSEATPQSTIVAQVYETYIEGLLTRSNWHFAMMKEQLTKLDETPINEWKYTYLLPVKSLRLRSVWTSSQTSILTTNEYEIFELRHLYSDHDGLWADFIYRLDESYWPPYFIEFVTSALASEIAMAITRDTNMAQLLKQEAFGSPAENGQGGLYAEAARQDAAQNPGEMLRLDYLQAARFSFGTLNCGDY